MTSIGGKLIEVVAYDHVIIAGQRIARPVGITVGEWEEFWRDIKAGNDYDAGYRDGHDEVVGSEEGQSQVPNEREIYDEGYNKGYEEGRRVRIKSDAD